MSTPPFRHVAGVAKHGDDADLIALRQDIRWLANWATDLQYELKSMWAAATVEVSSTAWDESAEAEVREVKLHLKLTDREIWTLAALLNPDLTEEP